MAEKKVVEISNRPVLRSDTANNPVESSEYKPFPMSRVYLRPMRKDESILQFIQIFENSSLKSRMLACSKPRSFKMLKKELLSMEKSSRDKKIFDLKYAKFKIGDNLVEYFDKISRLIEEIYGPNQNQLIRDNILAGLDYKIVSRLMINQKLPDDIADVKSLIEELSLVIKEVHDEGAHMGINKTYETLSQRFYLPQLQKKNLRLYQTMCKMSCETTDHSKIGTSTDRYHQIVRFRKSCNRHAGPLRRHRKVTESYQDLEFQKSSKPIELHNFNQKNSVSSSNRETSNIIRCKMNDNNQELWDTHIPTLDNQWPTQLDRAEPNEPSTSYQRRMKSNYDQKAKSRQLRVGDKILVQANISKKETKLDDYSDTHRDLIKFDHTHVKSEPRTRGRPRAPGVGRVTCFMSNMMR
ncbi:hypothetical protein SSS_07416 [Sarcoptes scabiei]|uniref:Integrase zinc-binding domain-containing protein n=1 Tax=Sarcoptes scabiei TaxID=52283 RepID=A0A834RKR3_SARSC|nr:hypothetical protein SSS_07416 [Sarcoptes scabiei]